MTSSTPSVRSPRSFAVTALAAFLVASAGPASADTAEVLQGEERRTTRDAGTGRPRGSTPLPVALELFVDAREALGPAVSVSDDWTHFFSLNRRDLRRVSVLVGSKVVHLTIAIAQHLSRTGDLIQIYSDPETFGARVTAARTS